MSLSWLHHHVIDVNFEHNILILFFFFYLNHCCQSLVKIYDFNQQEENFSLEVNKVAFSQSRSQFAHKKQLSSQIIHKKQFSLQIAHKKQFSLQIAHKKQFSITLLLTLLLTLLFTLLLTAVTAISFAIHYCHHYWWSLLLVIRIASTSMLLSLSAEDEVIVALSSLMCLALAHLHHCCHFHWVHLLLRIFFLRVSF